MRPHEYVLQIQRQRPFPVELTSHYESIESEWGRQLKPRLPKILEKCFATGYIAYGIVFDFTANAYNKSVEPCGWAILFNVGLVELIYSVARTLATRVKTSEESTVPAFQVTALLLQEVVQGFRDGTLRAAAPDFPLEQGQIEWAAELAREAELFIIAHELGHVVRRHLDSVLPRLLKDPDPETAALFKRLTAQDHFEFDADEIGFLLAMGIYSAVSGPTTEVVSMRYRGAEFTLQLFRALEHLGVPFGCTHPPAGERLAKMRSLFGSYCEWDAKTDRHISNLIFVVVCLFERELADFDAAFNPRSSRLMRIWAFTGPPFAERAARGAYWIEELFLRAGLVS